MPRGQLRVYLGAAPGVGKTYAMLGEAHRRLERGTDIVVGLVETHGREHTAELLAGLEVIPRREIIYRGSPFTEMDVDAVIARHPKVVLVDELAHTNVSGSRNTKRWEDVEELLEAGIDVITTVNIQHLESLNDVVESITGIKQQETVPDSVVRQADQIELKDMSPQALRRRLAHGNVYATDKVDAAMGNYFRVGNLTALRELALLWLADRVDEGLEKYRAEHEIEETWPARQRIVVALTGGAEGQTLLRRGAVVAGRSEGRDLVAVHVVRGDGTAGASPQRLAEQRQLTEELGGSFHTVVGDNIAATILEFARSVNGTRIVVGESRRGRISTAIRPSTADLVVRDSGDIDVQVVTHESASHFVLGTAHRSALPHQRLIVGGLLALALPILTTLLLLTVREHVYFSVALVAFVFGVIASALVGGLVPALIASAFSAALADYYFTQPYGSFRINDVENRLAIVLFAAVGITISVVVNRSAAIAAEGAKRRAEADVLAALSAGVLGRKDALKGLLEQAQDTFGMQSAALFERHAVGTTGRESVTVVEAVGSSPPTSPELADVTTEAGPGLVLALNGKPLSNSDRRILAAFAGQTAAVLERDRLGARAADAARLRESEAIRNTLLAAISHDLRTPLAGIKAALATLRDPSLDIPAGDQIELLESAEDSTDRLIALVANLLDMTRLQTGALRPVFAPAVVDELVQKVLGDLPDGSVIDEVPEDLPLVTTDQGLLERVLVNVIENAVQHSPAGQPPRVSADCVPEAKGDRIEIRVIDRGPGVPEDQKESIFEPFNRLNTTPEAGGVGLGLAVARGLAEVVGATLDAEDTPGGGLTMVISIPTQVTVRSS